MSNLNTSIREGFYDKLLTGTNDFKTAITTANGSKLFYGEAPQMYPSTQINLDLPFVVFNTLPITSSRDSGDKFFEAVIQFNIAGTNLSECEDVSNKLTNELEDSEASLTFTSYDLIRIEEAPRIDQGNIDGVWNFTIQYTINLQES